MAETRSADSTSLLTSFLVDSDARCPACRYALRGCTSDRCPECGCELALQVGSPRIASGWWMAGVIGLSTSAALLFLALLGLGDRVLVEMQNPGLRLQVNAGFASRMELPRWTPILLLALMLLAATLALAWLATRRETMMRMHNPRRAIIGLLAAASPLLTLGGIAFIGRWA